MSCRSSFVLGLVLASASGTAVSAWDHPSHMTTAAIAFAEIERQRPDLIEPLGLMLMKHPDPAPFWVAASGATDSRERARRMFIQAARWPDDSKGTSNDRLSWHSARYPIIADDASPETRALIEAREGDPAGDAIEALQLQAAVMANPEAGADERALALTWFLHVAGDIHQPMHVTDLFSAEYPTGNSAGAQSYVWDPLLDSATTLHILWDSNFFRSTALGDVDRYAVELVEKYPRSAFEQLGAPSKTPDFEAWARETHQIAVDFAYGGGIEFVSDPDKDQTAEQLVGKMVKYILFGVSPLEDAPEVPAEYWEQLQENAQSQVTLAGYRMADVIIAAADSLIAERSLSGRILDAADNVPERAGE
jgi:hypothetical protein